MQHLSKFIMLRSTNLGAVDGERWPFRTYNGIAEIFQLTLSLVDCLAQFINFVIRTHLFESMGLPNWFYEKLLSCNLRHFSSRAYSVILFHVWKPFNAKRNLLLAALLGYLQPAISEQEIIGRRICLSKFPIQLNRRQFNEKPSFMKS